jgi:hypothetical protein
MHWNHRVFNLKDQNGGEDYFEVRETYYDENDKVIGSSDLSVGSETVDGIKWIAEQIIKCLEQPVLLPENEKHPNDIVQDIIDHLDHGHDLKIGCDLSDVGNNIGVAIGKYVNEDKLGYEIESLIAGIKHGISLIDGTH